MLVIGHPPFSRSSGGSSGGPGHPWEHLARTRPDFSQRLLRTQDPNYLRCSCAHKTRITSEAPARTGPDFSQKLLRAQDPNYLRGSSAHKTRLFVQPLSSLSSTSAQAIHVRACTCNDMHVCVHISVRYGLAQRCGAVRP